MFEWLTLSACVLMWGPCLVERLFKMSKWSTQHYDNGVVVPKSGGSESDNNQGTLVELQSFIYRKVAKVSFIVQCAKMQLITFQNFNIQIF